MSSEFSKKRIVVAMSGGVDSSVAAALLTQQGHDVIGVTMKTYAFDEVGGNIGNETSCCGLDAFNDARMVAVSLRIPHYVVDFTKQFEGEVISNFVDEYLQGRTPNPCIICNKKLKWGALLAKAEALGADCIATGHYARLAQDPDNGRWKIKRPKDTSKDQTYALWGLSQEALAKTVFPLGDMTKKEVRAVAASLGIRTADKEESFEICFVADNDYRRFLHERVGGGDALIGEGDIIYDGKVVGRHRGFPYYTIGQRSGLGAFGEKVYVREIDAATNTITVGRADSLLRRGLVAKDVNLVSVADLTSGMSVDAQVRYKDTPASALISPLPDGRIEAQFVEPKRAITPGRSFVFYVGDELAGGGIIEALRD